MTKLSTALEEHKTQLRADLAELEEELQRRKDKDDLGIGNSLRQISREIEDWERDAGESDDSTEQFLMTRARELRSELVKLRSD